jgi:hypothetical protein
VKVGHCQALNLMKMKPPSAQAGGGFFMVCPAGRTHSRLVKSGIAARCRLNGLPHTGDGGLRGVSLRLGRAHRFADNRSCQYVSVTLPIGFGGVGSLGGLRRAAHDSG